MWPSDCISTFLLLPQYLWNYKYDTFLQSTTNERFIEKKKDIFNNGFGTFSSRLRDQELVTAETIVA